MSRFSSFLSKDNDLQYLEAKIS